MADNYQFILGRIEGKQDETLRRLDEMHSNVRALEGRVATLEAFRWQLMGIAAAASFVVNYLMKVL